MVEGLEARVEVAVTQHGTHVLSAAESSWKCKHAVSHDENLKKKMMFQSKLTPANEITQQEKAVKPGDLNSILGLVWQ